MTPDQRQRKLDGLYIICAGLGMIALGLSAGAYIQHRENVQFQEVAAQRERTLELDKVLRELAKVGPTKGMTASWYGLPYHGRKTASGVPFDRYAMTCAHPRLPFFTKLEVSYGGRSVVVTVTDRGPFIPGRDLDLSEAAARALGMPDVARVCVRRLS